MLRGFGNDHIPADVDLENTQLLTVPEAAKVLRLSVGMVYKLVQMQELRALRFGSAVRIRDVDIEDYISRNYTRGE